MKKSNIKHVVLYAIILVCILYCKNPTREDSMQPYAGYPLLDNIDSIKKCLRAIVWIQLISKMEK